MPRGEPRHADISVFRQSLHDEFALFKTIVSQNLILNEIVFGSAAQNVECQDWTRLRYDDPLREVFVMFFLFEVCLTTCDNGGVQLDRLVLPNLSYIEMNGKCIQGFFQSNVFAADSLGRLCGNSFSFLVQDVSRVMQSIHLDESEAAVLFFMALTQSVSAMRRHSATEIKRSNLLAELTKSQTQQSGSAEPSRNNSLLYLVGQLLQGASTFQEVLALFYVANIPMSNYYPQHHQ
ncbi:unnamed protein product [Caenorhabditis bovis]|uniref:Uncharacterized protein n=1 Tax=Caenorhabditis bovis TaxID=2654633 RepID=A0A8S1F0D4_9PELO|nr:unnamed protein product [Caenorhabditis bovis]